MTPTTEDFQIYLSGGWWYVECAGTILAKERSREVAIGAARVRAKVFG